MRLAVYSTMFGPPWGGSEELWSQAAAVLLGRGHGVAVNFKRRKTPAPNLVRLGQQGAVIHFRRGLDVGRSLRRLMNEVRLGRLPHRGWLKAVRPDLALISIGYHTDDVSITRTCQALGIPYALVLQAASPYQWIEPHSWETHRAGYLGAARCFFVSEENRRTIESNLAVKLSNSEIVDNPFNVRRGAAPPWPSASERWRLACVARLQFQAKGQDLLVHVLSQARWRSRPLEVVLWGDDGGSRGRVQTLIRLHGLEGQIKLGGFAADIEAVWRDHHGLILPSRFEGNPLAMTEAMLCGRIPIVTNVGRAAQFIDDDRTGFIAPAATVELVGDALERAWRRRHDWQAMGQAAAQAIRERHSLTPAEDFADALLRVAELQSPSLRRAA
jgi:glycosyltransferase involved in cell wall biosynthesis